MGVTALSDEGAVEGADEGFESDIDSDATALFVEGELAFLMGLKAELFPPTLPMEDSPFGDNGLGFVAKLRGGDCGNLIWACTGFWIVPLGEEGVL